MRNKLALAFASAMTTVSANAANALIVNISGTANGEQTGGVNCVVACEGPLIDPVQVTLGPGTYVITDAYSPSTGLQAGAIYEAWNYEAGNPDAWAWHWKVLLDDGSDGSTITPANYASYILLDVDRTESFTTESAAAAFGAATPASTLSLNETTTLDFVVNDYYLPDNAGGVSLDITGGVPETYSWVMMLIGVTAIGCVLRSRARAFSTLPQHVSR